MKKESLNIGTISIFSFINRARDISRECRAPRVSNSRKKEASGGKTFIEDFIARNRSSCKLFVICVGLTRSVTNLKLCVVRSEIRIKISILME